MSRFALLALCLFATLGTAQDLVPDQVLELELRASDPLLAGHGPARTFEYPVTKVVVLYVWAASEDLDPFLRVTKPTGELWAEDDDTGGGTTAFLVLEVQAGELPSFTVAAAEAQMTGSVRLHVSERPPRSGADLSAERKLVDESNAARNVGGWDSARAKASEAAASLLAQADAEQDAAWLVLLHDAGYAAYGAQDSLTANSAWKRVYEVRSRTLPQDHPALQAARLNLANTLYALGDFVGAQALYEQVLEVNSRTLPQDHPALQSAQQGLAITLKALGDLAGARALLEQVLEVRSRTLPQDHPELQAARQGLANTIRELGDLAGARALQEQVLEVNSRTLPQDHPALQRSRQHLAATLFTLGDLAGARALEEQVLEVNSRTLPQDHPELQMARLNLAATIKVLGNLAGARALQEQVLEVYSRTLPQDHTDLQAARLNLAGTLYTLGDLAGARAQFEQVLEVYSRTLPQDHPYLQAARQNLASTLAILGDLAGARALFEQVLEVYSRMLPQDHPELQTARLNLANTMKELHDLAGTRALQEQVLEVCSRTLPKDHPYLQGARLNLAGTLKALGDLAGARALFEQVLEVNSRTLPQDHPDLQQARQGLAGTIASELARTARSPGVDGKRTRESEGGRERCAELIGALCRADVSAARAAILGSPAREAEERCASLAKQIDLSLSFAQGYGVFEPLRALETGSFVLSESTRGAALASAELTRRAARSPKYGELREALRAASDALASLAQKGTTSAEFDRARVKRESVERELVALARELSGGKESGAEFDAAALAARLAEREAAVAFRRYEKWSVGVAEELDSTSQPEVLTTSVESLCAFVVRDSKAGAKGNSTPTSPLTLVDLGPIAPIEAAVRDWRDAIGAGLERGLAAGASKTDRVRERGDELRRLVFDPLVPALGDAQRVVVALDDVLHLVPLEALPFAVVESAAAPESEAADRLVGDRWRIETRATLTELLMDLPPPSGTALVALGGASFNLPAVELSNEEVASFEARARAASVASSGKSAPVEELASAEPAQPAQVAVALRGTPWERGFTPLTHTGDEARGIAALYEELLEAERPVLVLEKRKASRAALEAVAPKARFVHIATHGWFAPESVRSWSDAEPLDKQSGLGSRLSGAEQVKGMSPMLLCGLALAGANLPEDAVGRAPGLVTADELSTFGLSNCELVVLSACDTNVGERRAGQGVASLQKALQMAGARSVITSLWKVPDEATKELMLDFYRRLWVEQKPKSQALWEAKTKLRHAKDETGKPKYTTRDWAAWVLTGDPN